MDTNIVIDHLQQTAREDAYLMRVAEEYSKEPLALSDVTIQELYEGKSTQSESREKDLLATISPLKILPYTYEIAQRAGKITRDHDQPIELADAAIAATTLTNDAKLATLNRKDFGKIANLELIEI